MISEQDDDHENAINTRFFPLTLLTVVQNRGTKKSGLGIKKKKGCQKRFLEKQLILHTIHIYTCIYIYMYVSSK